MNYWDELKEHQGRERHVQGESYSREMPFSVDQKQDQTHAYQGWRIIDKLWKQLIETFIVPYQQEKKEEVEVWEESVAYSFHCLSWYHIHESFKIVHEREKDEGNGSNHNETELDQTK